MRDNGNEQPAVTEQPPRWISATDAAKILGVAKDTLIRWVNKDAISSVRTPTGRYRFREDVVREHAETFGAGLLSTGAAAALVGVDTKTVARWGDAGRITLVRTPGGHRRFVEAEIRALLDGGAS